MTRGKKILRRVDAYFAADARRQALMAEEKRQTEAAAVAAEQQQELRRMRAAQFRQSRGRERRTMAQVQARRERDRREGRMRQQGAAAALRARAQARRDAKMMVEAFEANRRYEIERIIARRTNMQTREYEYCIRWRGFGSDKDQWRPRSELVADGVGSMLDAFDATQVSASAAAASSAAAGGSSSDSSDSSGSEVSSDSDSMDSADDDDDDRWWSPHSDDDDDDRWWTPPNTGARVSRYDDGTSTRLCAPSLLRRLNNHSYMFEGVRSASAFRF